MAVPAGIRFPRLVGVAGRARFLRTTAGVSQLEEGSMETSNDAQYVDNRIAVTIITGFLGAGKVWIE